MDALKASYGDSYRDTDSESPPSSAATENPLRLPPPPLSLLNPLNSLALGKLRAGQPSRVRSFPHVAGNFAVHVYIPVYIPSTRKKEMGLFLKKITSVVPGLNLVDLDIPLDHLCKDDEKLGQVALGREFHISLARTAAIQVHQIDSMVSMLRQKLQIQKRYWIFFNEWEIFVNDDHTRTFLSIEVLTGGLTEITKQIQTVNEVYKLHNLPEFYKDPRPHISVAWALGDISIALKRAVEEEMKRTTVGGSSKKCIFTAKFGGIECKIGKKTYKICKFPDE